MELLIVPIILAGGAYWLRQREQAAEEKTRQREQADKEEKTRQREQAADQTRQHEIEIAKKRAETEHDIAADNRQETALQTYLDRMAELLLDKKLRETEQYLFSWDFIQEKSTERLIEFLMQNYHIDWVKTANVEKIDSDKAIRVYTEKHSLSLRLYDETNIVKLEIDDGRIGKFIAKRELSKLNIYSEQNLEVRDVARARTLTVLRGLDGDRKGALLRFLYEADLIDKDKMVISLGEADLIGANLSLADLSRAGLSAANLIGANLTEATLSKANLKEADLSAANLTEATLIGANLTEVDLSRADLGGADLSAANLRGANLTEATLIGANPTGADLRRADLGGADLSAANLRGADLRRAKYTKNDNLFKDTI